MTTYSFVNQEYTSSGTTAYVTPQTIYTVPTGKIARVKFDMVMQNNLNTSMGYGAFLITSAGTNIFRKHAYGTFDSGNSGIKSASWYNPMDQRNLEGYGGTNTNPYYNYTESAQPENWLSGGSLDTTMHDTVRGYGFPNNQNYGTKYWGPSEWYMAAGEVLKYQARNSDTSGSSDTYYHNVRLMVFLEDS